MPTKTMNQTPETENEQSERQANANLREEAATEDFSGDLNAPVWSVVSFDTRLARNLTYHAAIEKLNEFFAAKVSGLCIVTDEAAERIGDNN